MSGQIGIIASVSCRSVIVSLIVAVVLFSAHAYSFEKSSHKLFASTKLKKADEQKVKTFMQATTPEDFDDIEFDENAHYDEPGVVPELPLIKLFNETPLEVGQSVTIGCLSRNGDPTADLFWYLNNKPLNETVLDFEEAGDDRSTSNTLSVIQWNVKIEDDGKILTCQARHPGYLKGFVETKHKLNINYAPTKQPLKLITGVELGKSVDISVSFRSNPKPTTIKWLVGDTKVYYGAKTGKCVSREIKAIGHNFWSASLHIANVTDKDISSVYKLQVRNPMGSADYLVQLKDNEAVQTTTQEVDDEVLTTTELPALEVSGGSVTVLMEDFVDQTTILNLDVETDVETTTSTDEVPSETTSKPFDTTLFENDLDSNEVGTEDSANFAEEFTTVIPSILEITKDSNNQSLIPKEDKGTNRIGSKTKVSKVVIFKRPVFVNSTESSGVDIGQTNDFGLHFIQSALTDVAAKAIVFWKTSLLVILTIVLILSFSYHRRRIMKLKAEIIQKNLGSSAFSQSSSTFSHNANAYTPTYFPRRLANNPKLSITLSDYDSSLRSRSNLYSQTYNSSFHSYESIIDLHNNDCTVDLDQLRKTRIDEDGESLGESGEHIYAEIPWSKESDDGKFKSDDENNSATSIIKYDYNHLDHTEPLNIEAPHIYHALIRQGTDPSSAMRLQIESTYI